MAGRTKDHPMSTQTPPDGWRGLADSLLPAGKRFIQRDGPRYGAAVAFYTLFSLAPLLVVVTAGVALLLGTDEAHAAIYAYLERFFGESEAKAMKSLADAALARVSGPGIAAWIAIGTTVVGASAVFLELQAALRRLWGAEDSPGAGLRGLIIGRLTGFALAFARGVGEYGSVIFIAGNMPMKTEILPLLIMVKLDQYDYTGATAIGVLMLVVSFILLLLINLLQRRIERP